MADLLVGTLLFVAVILGWLLGKFERKRQPRPVASTSAVPRDYFHGVNLLLNNQQEEAMEVFLNTLEVNPSTIETYLVMGSLFRRRGEVDRAIRIHQELLARPSLTSEQQTTVRLELAKDYLKAGLFDRSERILLNLVEQGGDQVASCLEKLLAIFEQEKEWQAAVDVARQLLALGHQQYHYHLAHYYCELALEANKLGDLVDARNQIKRALSVDENCVRASMIQGDIEHQRGNHKEAIKALRQVASQDSAFIPEILDTLEQSYEALQRSDEFTKYLFELLKMQPAISVVIKLAERIAVLENEKAGSYVLSEFLKKRPSVRGLHRLIDFHIPRTQGAARDNLTILQAFTQQLIADKPKYTCSNCGFQAKQLYWSCPSCRYWGSVKPVQGLEGE